MEPGMVPIKASNQLLTAVTACTPFGGAAQAVAPLKPSTAVQTLLPEICAG